MRAVRFLVVCVIVAGCGGDAAVKIDCPAFCNVSVCDGQDRTACEAGCACTESWARAEYIGGMNRCGKLATCGDMQTCEHAIQLPKRDIDQQLYEKCVSHALDCGLDVQMTCGASGFSQALSALYSPTLVEYMIGCFNKPTCGEVQPCLDGAQTAQCVGP
jgi:hypothetical protein